jgi:hypothetical protein
MFTNVQAANEVASRADIIDETIATLQKELELIHVTDDFPQGLPSKQLDNCQAAALILCGAIYEYLATTLRYLPRSAFSHLQFLDQH